MLLFIIFEDSRIAESSDLSMAVSVISNSCRTTKNKDVHLNKNTDTHKHLPTHGIKEQQVPKV